MDIELYGTVEAAKYLKLSVSTVKYHLYTVGDLKPDKVVAGRLIFTKQTLDAFNEQKRGPGRPSEPRP